MTRDAIKRRIDVEVGHRLIVRFAAGEELDKTEMKTAARYALEEFATRHPGRSVEIRLPWVGAVQAIAGPVHTRGTPPNVVEIDALTWLDVVVGNEPRGIISWSGVRGDLTGYLPLFGPTALG